MNFFESVAYRILPRLFRPCSPFSSHISSLHQDIPQWDKQNHLWGIYSSSRQSCPCKQYLHRILDLCLRIDHCRTENHLCSCTRILKKMTTVSIVRAAPRGNNSTTTIILFISITHVFILVQTLRRRSAERTKMVLVIPVMDKVQTIKKEYSPGKLWSGSLSHCFASILMFLIATGLIPDGSFLVATTRTYKRSNDLINQSSVRGHEKLDYATRHIIP